jgi:hypothetical protein
LDFDPNPWEVHMTCGRETPFDDIEVTYEYLTLLSRTIKESTREVAEEMSGCVGRRREGFELALYTLSRLEAHVCTSRRLVKNLGLLRRLLVSEAEDRALSLVIRCELPGDRHGVRPPSP